MARRVIIQTPRALKATGFSLKAQVQVFSKYPKVFHSDLRIFSRCMHSTSDIPIRQHEIQEIMDKLTLMQQQHNESREEILKRISASKPMSPFMLDLASAAVVGATIGGVIAFGYSRKNEAHDICTNTCKKMEDLKEKFFPPKQQA